MKHRLRYANSTSGRTLRAVSGALAVVLLFGLTRIARAQRAPAFTVLYTFTGEIDGGSASASLIRAAAGNLYGTTPTGGAYSLGTVFRLDPYGRDQILYSFMGAPDGGYPLAPLIHDAAGNLYGTTYVGGDTSCGNGEGCGTVFKLSTGGVETVLYRFTDGADGGDPLAGVIRDAAGNLYGTTFYGGDSSCQCGTVFKLDASGVETTLHIFTGEPDGAYPYAGVFRDAAGNFYGTTEAGGASCTINTNGCGTVFRLDATGQENVLHAFTGGADGAAPLAGVTRDAAGNLYGTTLYGGDTFSCNTSSNGCGTVFKLDATGKKTVLHAFQDGKDGALPYAGVIGDAAGNLYCDTEFGGSYMFGVIFKITP